MYYVYRRERLDPEELTEKYSPIVANDLAEREKYALAGDRGLGLEEGSLEDLARKFVKSLNVPPRRVPFMELQDNGLVLRGEESPLADSLRYEPPSPVTIRKRELNTPGPHKQYIDAYRNYPLKNSEIKTFEQGLIGALRDFRKQ